uniref:Alpha/beta hydrolase n=1 Tax=Desulfomonile tiedjei TaxID=2358 RepID=A0A7C4ASD1_9BACT
MAAFLVRKRSALGVRRRRLRSRAGRSLLFKDAAPCDCAQPTRLHEPKRLDYKQQLKPLGHGRRVLYKGVMMPFVQLRGKKIAYAVNPEAYDASSLALVFVHGSGGDREDWRDQLSGLSETATALAIELPGHGKSDGPGESSVAAYAAWVADFVEALGLSRVMLVGCSLGSAITQWIALIGKPWLQAIGLVGAGARLRVHPSFLEGLKKEDGAAALSLLADFCLSPHTGEPLRSFIDQKMRAVSADIVYGDLKACDEFDVMDRLKKITVPTWIIVGQDDRLTPPKYAQFLHKEIRDSWLHVVGQAGHLISLEAPETFNNLLKEFIQQRLQ